MPTHPVLEGAVAQLVKLHGGALVDAAARKTLLIGEQGNAGSLTQEILKHSADHAFDFEAFERNVLELAKIGKPLIPAAVKPGAAPQPTARIGIQGNPIEMDYLFQSGWHFAQSNRWDTWFNIVPRLEGGYYIFTPASRVTGSQGEAIYGVETIAAVTAPGTIEFDVQWNNGASGHYTCWRAADSTENLEGKTRDNNHPGVQATFRGSKMPLTAKRPGTMQQTPSQTRRTPQIMLDVLPNMSDNGYTVTVGGSGFMPDELVHIEGKAIQGGHSWEWTSYTQAKADAVFGQLRCEPFGIFMPQGTKYVFRGRGEHSGYTAEVGV